MPSPAISCRRHSVFRLSVCPSVCDHVLKVCEYTISHKPIVGISPNVKLWRRPPRGKVGEVVGQSRGFQNGVSRLLIRALEILLLGSSPVYYWSGILPSIIFGYLTSKCVHLGTFGHAEG